MLGGLFGLNRKQKLYMAGACGAPIVVALTSLYATGDGLITILAVNAIAYILIPYIYIKYLSKEQEVGVYFLNEFRDRHHQIKTGISLFASAFGLVMLGYLMLFKFRQHILLILELPLKGEALYIVLFFLVFALVNPVLEEWFWRLFIPKTYSSTEINKYLIVGNYTLFNFVAMSFAINWTYAMGLATTFYSISQSFEFIKEKYGFITSIITHIGLSLGSALVLLDILYLEGSTLKKM